MCIYLASCVRFWCAKIERWDGRAAAAASQLQRNAIRKVHRKNIKEKAKKPKNRHRSSTEVEEKEKKKNWQKACVECCEQRRLQAIRKSARFVVVALILFVVAASSASRTNAYSTWNLNAFGHEQKAFSMEKFSRCVCVWMPFSRYAHLMTRSYNGMRTTTINNRKFHRFNETTNGKWKR